MIEAWWKSNRMGRLMPAALGASTNVYSAYDANLKLDIPDGDDGIISTLWVMRACIDDAVETAGPVMRLAHYIAATVAAGTMAKLRGVYDFLVKRFVYMDDPKAFEHVRHPDQMAIEIEKWGKSSGDCDDVATLGAALLKCMGFSAVLIVVSARPDKVFHHVLFGARVRGVVIPLDPQERMFDQFPGFLTRKLVFDC